MNLLYISLLISILIFQIFQFFFFINIIKNLLNSLDEKVHALFKKEIMLILNDKELYDNIKDYAYSIISSVINKTQNKNSSTNLTQLIINSLFQRFIPALNEGNSEVQKETKTRNPFTK